MVDKKPKVGCNTVNKGGVKGGIKTPNSGRKAGTPNKKTINLEAKLEEKGLDVAVEMIQLFNECEDQGLKYNILKELMKYVYPQRKAVDMELTGKDGEPLATQKVYVLPDEIKEIDKHIKDTLEG